MEEIDIKQQKSPSLVMTIAAVAVLTLVAGGGGWLVGIFLAPPPAEKAEAVAEVPENATGEEGLPKIATEANGIVQLEPITTNLAYPAENWVRVEVALQFKGVPDVALAEEIHQDIIAYLKTVSLQQIQGPRAFNISGMTSRNGLTCAPTGA